MTAALDRAEEIVRREYGPCSDSDNHDERNARWAVEALAENALLVTDEISALLDYLAYHAEYTECRTWNSDLARLVDLAIPTCTCANGPRGRTCRVHQVGLKSGR